MERPSMARPRRALRAWATLLALAACAVAAGEWAAMRHGQSLRRARPEMYLEDAVARKNAGDFPGALASWREARERGPEEPAVYKVLGDIHHRMEDWAKAAPAYEEALRLGSAAPGVRMNLLECYLRLGRHDAVVDRGLRFVAEGGTTAGYERYVATACFRAGRFDEAIGYLRAVLEAAPDDLRIMDLLRQCCERTGRGEEAARLAEAIRDVENRLSGYSEEVGP